MKFVLLISAAVVLAAVGVSSLTIRQAAYPTPPQFPAGPLIGQPVVTAMEGREWADERWTGDAAPYRQAAQEIDRSLASGSPPQALVDADLAAADARPKDPLALFRWGYAQWRAITAPYGSGDKYTHMTPVYEAMAQAPSPHVYEYARLRYLSAQGDNDLIPLGERLLALAPNDLQIVSRLVDDYEGQISVMGWKYKRLDTHARARALALAEQALRAHPEEAGYHSLLASVYVTCWTTKLSPQDRGPALQGYEDYLRLAPPDDVFRPQAEQIIKLLETPGYDW